MKHIMLSITEDYLPKFAALLKTLPADKIHIVDQDQEDEQLASMLHQDNKRDFVSEEAVLKALRHEH